jgi:hypothetical protein
MAESLESMAIDNGTVFASCLGYKAAQSFRTTLVPSTYFWTTP